MSEEATPSPRRRETSAAVRALGDVGTDDQRRAVREAFGDLRREIRTRFSREVETASPREGAGWERTLLELPRWLANLGMRERSGAVDDFGMDAMAVEGARPLLDLLFDRYWRVDADGDGPLPVTGPAIFASNRSGLLPWDALMLAHAIERRSPEAGRARFALADGWIAMPFLQSRLTRLGGVRACPENLDRLLETGRRVAVFPEGAKGATKSFADRYRVQRFGRGEVVRAAIARRAPLVPVGIVGAEETNPILYKATTPARALGLPFLPVTPTFPWLGPAGALPLPTQWVIRFGEPLALEALPPEAADDELLVARLTEELRGRVQALVDDARAARATVWSLGRGRDGR